MIIVMIVIRTDNYIRHPIILLKVPVYRIYLAARMSIILSHSEVLLGQNHRNLNCVSMHIFVSVA